MLVELWSDFACPYCYIGEVRFKHVLAELGREQEVKIIMKSFELDPYASRKVTGTTTERFARKYGLSVSQAAAQIEAISALGRAEGIDFRYVSTRYSNMFDAHRLSKFGLERNHPEIVHHLFAAYFTENLDLCDQEVLLSIAKKAHLPEKEARAVLESDAYGSDVREDEKEAALQGIHGVPYFLIDKKIVISGAQSAAAMKSLCTDILAGEEKRTASAGMMCGPEGCRI